MQLLKLLLTSNLQPGSKIRHYDDSWLYVDTVVDLTPIISLQA